MEAFEAEQFEVLRHVEKLSQDQKHLKPKSEIFHPNII